MSLRRKDSVVTFGVVILILVGGVMWGVHCEHRVTAAPPEKTAIRLKASESQDVDEESSKAKQSLARFMREKMDAQHDIMEGLLMEDGKLIHKAARKLKAMSDTERWRVSNDIMYRNHSDDFRNAVDKLIVASQGNSIDRAALSWFDVTLSCIDCHRYVRTVLIAENE